MASRGDLRFLSEFHIYLQASVSHYTLDEDASVRLMLSYYEWLIRIRQYVKHAFNLDILYNLEAYQLLQDDSLKEYYEKIATAIGGASYNKSKPNYRCYIQKKKPFLVGGKIYCEITVTPAHNYASKFHRFTVFTDKDIPSYYAIKLNFIDTHIDILNRQMPIRIVNAYKVAIHPIEFEDLSKIFGLHTVGTSSKEYLAMMDYLTDTGMNFIDIIDFDEAQYLGLKQKIQSDRKSNNLFAILDTCRQFSLKQKVGFITLRYLLLRLRHKIIREQLSALPNNWISNLQLENGCLSFENMPFDASLIKHNPAFWDVIRCFNSNGREHEILARKLRINTEQKVQLYTPLEEVYNLGDIGSLVQTYNFKLIPKHANRSLVIEKDNIFIQGCENDTVNIIQDLIGRIGEGIEDYFASVSNWLANNSEVDCEEKKNILSRLFDKSNLALIYGAAGTGKTRLIRHIAEYFADKQKLFLAYTNPAKENLRRQIKLPNCEFSTIASSKPLINSFYYDIVFIDECSTVDNRSMVDLLNNLTCDVFVLVGDVYQIQSIRFGNWFGLARSFLPSSIIYELTTPYRSRDNRRLKMLWDKVRNLDQKTPEFIVRNHYSSPLDDSLFVREQQDEIILCLNYDGLYGINNVNRFMQEENPNKAITWDSWTYKVGDPVIFVENNRFASVLYNNLKGWIRGITKTISSITFEVEVDMPIDKYDAMSIGVELLNCETDGHSLIRFSVDHFVDDDINEREVKQVVPFQVSYAISIHKAQGLEYDSVKVIVTNAIEDLITHNIFYTAITRARKNLKIYWTPETQKKILSEMTLLFSYQRDSRIISNKYGLAVKNMLK